MRACLAMPAMDGPLWRDDRDEYRMMRSWRMIWSGVIGKGSSASNSDRALGYARGRVRRVTATMYIYGVYCSRGSSHGLMRRLAGVGGTTSNGSFRRLSLARFFCVRRGLRRGWGY